MRRILVLEREDLATKFSLLEVKDVYMVNFDTTIQQLMDDADVILFHCNLKNEVKFLKNRWENPDCGKIDLDNLASIAQIGNIVLGTI